MHLAIGLLALVATVLLVAGLSRRYGFSAPLALLVVGIIGSYLPFVTEVHLTTDVVLLGFLPPLLYSAAIKSSLVDFNKNRRTIGFLSVGLVLFTAAGVGLVTWLLLPVPFAAAFALGAVVAPPDAVAATSIARRIGLPRRIVTILEGESLLNDATALVALRTAIAAILAVVGVSNDSVSVGSISLDFLVAAGGGVLVGLVIAFLVAQIRKRVSDPVVDTSLSFLTPFAAYLPAEEIHASGVIAVVVAGLILGHKAPVLQGASSRLSERINWSTIQFLLENSVFLLIGLQVRWILDDVAASTIPIGQIVVFCIAVLLAVILLRPLWIFPTRYLFIRPKNAGSEIKIRWQTTAIVSWAGMRGVVTLAAVFLLPEETPHREVLVLAAMVVTAGTLLIQGLSLPWMARKLDVHGPNAREDALQEATVLQSAVTAGLTELDRVATEQDSAETLKSLRVRASARTNTAWEQLGRNVEGYETPSEQYRRLRLLMLIAERDEVLRIRDEGKVDHEVLSAVMGALDLEESLLDRYEERSENLRASPLTVVPLSGACEDLTSAPTMVNPLTPEGCPDCVREGTDPVHVRLCLTCGNVGCCESSVGDHATRHFHDTGHAVMRSFEPGEEWRWCYTHSLLG